MYNVPNKVLLRVRINLAQNAIARKIVVKSTETHSLSNEILYENRVRP